jgi:ATP-binding cassette subfamily C protein CydC
MTTCARLLKLAAPFRWWVALAVLLCFGVLGASVGLMAMSAFLISKAALASGFSQLAVIVTAVRAFAIGRAALRYAERYVSHLATFRILTRLRVWFYTAVEPLAPARLDGYRGGDLLTRIVADIETLDQFYVRVVVPPIAAALVTALSCLILGSFDVRLGLVLLAFLLLTGVVLPLITRRLSHAPSVQVIGERAALNAALTDEIQGMADVLAFGREERLQAQVFQRSDRLQRAQVRLALARGMSNALAALLAGLAGLTILLLAIPLTTGGEIARVYLALLPLTAIAAFEAVQPLGAALQHFESSQAAAQRLFELIDAPPSVSDPARPMPPPAEHSIEFRDVRFRYASDSPPVLDGVSFQVPEGGRLAVTGESGAGKSTLINLLVRFWDAQAGEVRVGGHDVRAYRSADLRERIGVVSQQVHLFNGTIRDNLLLAKGDATDEEIRAACAQAQIHEFIASLPDGYDTLVGENGLKLSGGERQRIAVARVILKGAPILILDEATANLDAATEQAVMQALDSFMHGRTTLIISHRRSAFEHADQILVLDRGRVTLTQVNRPRGDAGSPAARRGCGCGGRFAATVVTGHMGTS